MSEGFHRKFEPSVAQAVVGVIPIRRREGRLELWARRRDGAAVAEFDDGEYGVVRVDFDGATGPASVANLLQTLQMAPEEVASAGRWETNPCAVKRYAWELFLAEVDGTTEGEGGEWKDVEAWSEAYDSGVVYPGPIFSHLLSVLTQGEATLREMGSALEARPQTSRIQITPSVQVMSVLTPTLPPATHTNCVIAGGGTCVVVDPASPYPEEQNGLRDVLNTLLSRGEKITRIVLTHHHIDHVGGVMSLREDFDVPVAAHPLTAERLKGHIVIDEFLEDGDRVPYGQGSYLRVLHTPGHASGHVILHEEKGGWAVVGDMVAGQGTIVIDPPEGNMVEYLRQLERMKALGLRLMIPSHGGMITDPEAWLSEYVSHRLWREGVIFDVIRENGPMPIPAIVPEAYGDVNPMVFPIAARQVEAHLEKLEAEGRVIRELGPRFRTSDSESNPS